MTDETAITESQYEKKSLAGYGARTEIRELGERIRMVLPGGKNLTVNEALALAQYGVASNLDPLRHECYWMPRAGPVPGIMGYRRKADEQLEYEVSQSNINVVPRWWCEFVPAIPGVDAEFDPEKGDIGYRCTLRDSLTQYDWEQRRLGAYIQLMKAGDEEAWEHAEGIVNGEPTWSAVGVVYGSENFKGDKPGSVERMDRHERAQKRAEKPAIKKRFPRIVLHEPVSTEVIIDDYEYPDAIDVEVDDLTSEPATPEVVIEELGFPPPEEPTDRTWDGELVHAIVLEKLAEHPKQAVAMLNLSNLETTATVQEVVAWCRVYRGHRESEGSKEESAALANASTAL